MDKTFSWSGIKKEAKRVRWPKRKDVAEDTGDTGRRVPHETIGFRSLR